MKKAILALAVLAVLALFTVPALAAHPIHTVTYGGWGVTGDDPSDHYDIIGSTVHFSGKAQQAADGTWTGKGIFMDPDSPDGPVRCRLVVDDGTLISPTQVELRGTGEFTIDKQYGGFWPFVLSLEQDGEFQTYKLAVTMGPTWWVSGINAINGGPVRIA